MHIYVYIYIFANAHLSLFAFFFRSHTLKALLSLLSSYTKKKALNGFTF